MLTKFRTAIAAPLAITGFGVALAIGANAVAICPAAPVIVRQLVTTVSCPANSACVSGTSAKGAASSSGAGVKAVS